MATVQPTNSPSTMPPMWGWTPTDPGVLFVLADRVGELLEFPVTLAHWYGDDDEMPGFTPWEDALSDFETLYLGHDELIAAVGSSPHAERWRARRGLDPARFDRWAAELAYGAYGLAKYQGSGSASTDMAIHKATSADLRRRLAVLVAGPLTERRWRRPANSDRRGRLFHWQSIAVPPWQPHEAVGIDEGIVDLVEACWAAGVPTCWSCQGGRGRQAYVAGAGGFLSFIAAQLSDVGWYGDGHFDPALIGPLTAALAQWLEAPKR